MIIILNNYIVAELVAFIITNKCSDHLDFVIHHYTNHQTNLLARSVNNGFQFRAIEYQYEPAIFKDHRVRCSEGVG